MKGIKNIQLLPKDTVYDKMSSPVGELTVIASADGLHAILWDNYLRNLACEKIINTLIQSKNNHILIQAKKQLTEYFQRKRKLFDLPLAPNGTHFQIQAWKQLQQIPYGTAISYAAQAEKIGHKNKARAVGMANGSNPIAIIIPCHRVIGSSGHLVGFGGGVDKKEFLLNLEKTI